MKSKHRQQNWSREKGNNSFREQERGRKSNDQQPKSKKGVVEPSVASYYQRCVAVLREDAFDSASDKKIFVSTVFETLSEDGFKVLQSQTLSRIIESFLEYADFKMLNVVLDIFRKNWDSSSTDWFAHRCLEKTIEIYQKLIESENEESEDFKAAAFKMSDFGAHMYEHYPQYIQHQRASHILRSYLKLLCGIRVKMVGSIEEVELVSEGLPNSKPIMKSLTETFLLSPHLQVSIEDPLTNIFLQMIVTCLQYRFPKKLQKVVKHLLDNDHSNFFECKEDDDQTSRFPNVFNSRQGSYFIERLIRFMSEKHFHRFYEMYIKENLQALALNNTSSFILQRVIERSDDQLFIHLTRNLAPQFTSIFGCGQVGVMVALISRGSKVQEAQKQLVSALRRCLQCNGEDPAARTAFLSCLCHLRIFAAEADNSEDSEKSVQINYHGSLMAQSIINYKKTGFITQSFLESELKELLELAKDSKGSFVFDALCKSSSVSSDVKLQIFERMKPILCQISCDKYGSRIFDTLWTYLEDAERLRVAKLLSEFKDKLSNDKYGHFVHRKFSLGNLHRKRDWRATIPSDQFTSSKHYKEAKTKV